MTLKREIKDAYIENGNSVYIKTHSDAVYVDANETETLTERLDDIKENTSRLNDITNGIGIGGRNYIQNSKSYSMTGDKNYFYKVFYTGLENNTTYTFSVGNSSSSTSLTKYLVRIFDLEESKEISSEYMDVSSNKKSYTFHTNSSYKHISLLVYPTETTPETTLNNQLTLNNVKLEKGIIATDWTPAPEDIDEQLNENTQKLSNYKTPEDFGAKGDGITDDTTSLKEAIAYCTTNNLELRGVKGKTYLTSEQLEITGDFFIDFRFATIKAKEDMFSVLKINSQSFYCRLRNMKIDCSSKSRAILVTCAREAYFDSIVITNSNIRGIQCVGGYGCIYTNIVVFGKNARNVGIEIGTSDNTFRDIYAIDCDIFVYNHGGTNLFDSCHAWILEPSIINSCIFMKIAKPTRIISCCSDTYKYSFWIEDKTGITVEIINNSIIYNPEYYNSTIATEAPTVFYIKDSSGYATQNIVFSNNYIYCPSKDNWGFEKGNLTNVNKNLFVGRMNNNVGFNIDPIDTDKFEITPKEDFDSSFKVTITRKNRRCLLKGQFHKETGMPTSQTVICELPDGLKPHKGFMLPIFFSDIQWGIKQVGYGYIDSDGVLKIQAQDNTMKYASINIEYDIKENELI